MSHGVYTRILPALLIVCLLTATAYADDATDTYEQAKDLYYQGKYDEALPLIDESISLNAKSSNSWNLKGLILMNLGRDQEALAAYNKSIELKPTNHIAYNNKGLAHKHLGQYQEALDSFNASLGISPTYTIAYYNRGNLQSQMGRFSDALKSLDSALSYDPHYANAWYAKGLVYQKTDEHEKALESFSRAIEENPEYKEAWYNKGVSFSKLGRNDEALDAFSQALRIDPGYVEAKNQKAQISSQASDNSSIFPAATSSIGEGSLFIVLMIFIVLLCAGAGLLVMKSRGTGPFRKNQYTRAESPPVVPSVSDTFKEKTTISHKGPSHDTLQGISVTETVTEEVSEAPEHSKKPPDTGSLQGQIPLNDAVTGSSDADKTIHHDVFISYSSQDKTVADAVCAGLEARKIRCWIAPRDLLPGMLYQEGIIRAIEECRVMVFIFSSHSNNSPHIIRELTKAVSTGAVIIPFRIEDIVPSKSMEYLIGAPHWLDALTPPLEAHIRTLVNTVDSLLHQTK